MPKRKAAAAAITSETDEAEPLADYPANKSYRLLEPGPVVLVTTRNKAGEPNIMTIGFHMVMQHDPPLLGAIIGPWDHSFAALRETKECVIAIPPVEMAATVVDIGNCSGADIDNKFEKFELTTWDAKKVKAPLVDGCIANLECEVVDTRMVAKYNMWVLRVVKGWEDPTKKDCKTFHHRGQGTFTVDGEILDLRDRMTLWREFQD